MNLRTIVDKSLPPPLRKAKAQLGRQARYVLGRLARVNEAPVFLLGNQKSGTTVIAAALAHCTDKSVTLDLRDLTATMLEGVYAGRVSLDAFIDRYRRAFARDLIKEPNLTFLYEDLVHHFPEAQFVMIMRDPRDNLRSFLNGYGLLGDLAKLKEEHRNHIHPLVELMIFGHELDLCRVGSKGNYIDFLAARWNLTADIYRSNQDHIHLIRYEDFCKNKVESIVGLAHRLRLTAEVDPSVIVKKQFQGRGDRSTPWQAFFGANNLARIEQHCRANMQRLGYDPANKRHVGIL